ncbi:hypothetical protein ACFIO0_19665 [Pseudosulfitobacter sp. SM2401]
MDAHNLFGSMQRLGARNQWPEGNQRTRDWMLGFTSRTATQFERVAVMKDLA